MGKIQNQDPGFWMNIPDFIFKTLAVFWVKNNPNLLIIFFDADPGSC
jgi:hypothetical protein